MKIVIYRDVKGEWRWKLVARNGRTVANGGEGYKRKSGILKTLNAIAAADTVYEEA